MKIVYLIKHKKTSSIYIGSTSNLKKRLSGEWMLVYAEVYRSEQDAEEREMKLKQYGSSKQKLLKRISRSLEIEKRAG